MLKKILIAGFSFWLFSYIYKCTPERWTSWERVYCETTYNLGMPLITFIPLATLDGTLPYCDADKLLPIEANPPVVYLGQGEDRETAINTLRHAAINRDSIVIWKNFLGSSMDKYKNKTFIKKNFNNDSYMFLTNFTNFKVQEIGLSEALHELDKLYLGFSYTLLDRNPILWQDINTVLNSYGPELQSIIPVNQSRHHAFMYEGKAYHTGLHQAPLSDWFLQISNTKKWTFIQPKYTPYVKAMTADGISLVSPWDFIPQKTKVPRVDILTEAGDLMYFPPHWWHEVHNVYDDFGLAFGFRPKFDALHAPIQLLTPWTTHAGELGHRALFVTSLIRNLLIPKTRTDNADSGVKSRESEVCGWAEKVHAYVPNWTWDKHAPIGSPMCPFQMKMIEKDPSVESSLHFHASHRSAEL